MEMSRKAICPRLREGPRSVRPRGIDVAVTHSLVMHGLRPRLSGSRLRVRHEMPVAPGLAQSRARPGRGIEVAVAHSLVMPGLGPGIHEFRGHPRYKCRWNGPFPCAELVDTRPK